MGALFRASLTSEILDPETGTEGDRISPSIEAADFLRKLVPTSAFKCSRKTSRAGTGVGTVVDTAPDTGIDTGIDTAPGTESGTGMAYPVLRAGF